jgi:hypothetical protein
VRRDTNQGQHKLQVLHCRSDRLLDRVVQLMSYICKLYSYCFIAMVGDWLVVEYVERVFGQLARASTTMIQPSASQDQIFCLYLLLFLKSCLHSGVSCSPLIITLILSWWWPQSYVRPPNWRALTHWSAALLFFSFSSFPMHIVTQYFTCCEKNLFSLAFYTFYSKAIIKISLV